MASYSLSDKIVLKGRGSAWRLNDSYTTAVATVQRTDTPFNYKLVITRAYQEGEAELLDDYDDEEDEDRTFLLDEILMPRVGKYEGNMTFIWRDLDEADAAGSSSDENLFEFVADSKKTGKKDFAKFYEVVLRALYERKFGESSEKVTATELEKMFAVNTDAQTNTTTTIAPTLPPSIAALGENEYLLKEEADIYLWDNEQQGFIGMFDNHVEVRIAQTGQYDYWLVIRSEGNHVLAHPIGAAMNGKGSSDHRSFTWNYETGPGVMQAWCIILKDNESYGRLAQMLSRCLYEVQNALDWAKLKEIEQSYVVTAMTEDVEMADAEADDEAEVAGELATTSEDTETDSGDESDQQPTKWNTKKKNKNSGLAVGHKGIAVVLRGDQLGIFKETTDGKLELGGTVNEIKAPGTNGKSFNPNKVMFHDQDRTLVMMNPNNQHSLYQMDVETGKVVEEWKLHEDITINSMTPLDKLAPMEPEQTLLGASHNALFRVDPRVSGNKLVQEGMKQYATRNKFSSIVTTGKGHIAVGSEKGDIRLFDTLGKIAKTTLPALGDPIRGIDVTQDGKFLVATCKTYLLVINATIGSGKNAGSSGFTKSFPADAKPVPMRLQLRPEHVAYMGAAVNFSPAKFNIGRDAKETAIITSSGPFVIAWDFNQVKKGKLDRYEIKKYTGNVVEDNFSFGNDKEIIVTLQDDVLMIPKKALKKPNRASLVTPGNERKSRSSIVNAPY